MLFFAGFPREADNSERQGMSIWKHERKTDTKQVWKLVLAVQSWLFIVLASLFVSDSMSITDLSVANASKNTTNHANAKFEGPSRCQQQQLGQKDKREPQKTKTSSET